MSYRRLFSFGLVLLFGAALGFFLAPAMQNGEAARSGDKLDRVLQLIDKNYVETVSADEVAERGIEGMLNDLDPHSSYITAEDMRSVRERFAAEFEGIGISYEFTEGPDGRDTVTVLSVIAGGPSEEVGLLPGDRIVRVADSSAVGFTSAEVQRSLKGPKGSEVRVTVRRPGAPERLDFTIERDEIPLNTLDVAYMIDDSTGYMKINRFASTTYSEFAEGLARLKGEGMQRLMLDLRGNSGGYMQQAIRLADAFLKDDQEIVSQRGRRYNEAYEAAPGGGWEGQPLLVLVDEGSASASEIVSGALQDHDRALLAGRRTFGKGLVQKQFELPDRSVLRLTIARYYTPTGRLIQTPYESGEDREEYITSKRERFELDEAQTVEEILARAPDSLVYRTAHGRRVLGGGGILPDVLVHRDTLSAFVQAIRGRNVGEIYSRRWVDGHREARTEWDGRQRAFLQEFDVTQDMYSDFLALAQERGVHMEGGASVPDSARVFTSVNAEEARPYLSTFIKSRIARRLFGQEAIYPILLQIDPVFQEAQTHWERAQELARLEEGSEAVLDASRRPAAGGQPAGQRAAARPSGR